MALVNRGRLSGLVGHLSSWTARDLPQDVAHLDLGVQPVEDWAYEAVVLLGRNGGWDGLMPKKVVKRKSTKSEAAEADGEDVVDKANEVDKTQDPPKMKKGGGTRAKAKRIEQDVDGDTEGGEVRDETQGSPTTRKRGAPGKVETPVIENGADEVNMEDVRMKETSKRARRRLGNAKARAADEDGEVKGEETTDTTTFMKGQKRGKKRIYGAKGVSGEGSDNETVRLVENIAGKEDELDQSKKGGKRSRTAVKVEEPPSSGSRRGSRAKR